MWDQVPAAWRTAVTPYPPDHAPSPAAQQVPQPRSLTAGMAATFLLPPAGAWQQSQPATLPMLLRGTFKQVTAYLTNHIQREREAAICTLMGAGAPQLLQERQAIGNQQVFQACGREGG
jgi:hypothetical protein